MHRRPLLVNCFDFPALLFARRRGVSTIPDRDIKDGYFADHSYTGRDKFLSIASIYILSEFRALL